MRVIQVMLAVFVAPDRGAWADRPDAVARDRLEAHLLRAITEAFNQDAVPMLVFKGAAVARTHYPQSWNRPRGDIDLLIRAADGARAHQRLGALGWRQLLEHDDPAITHQRHYAAPNGWPMTLDLHLAMFNVAGLSRSFDELWDRRQPVPGLEGASTLANADALWHAAVHRVVHHRNSDDRGWLEDIHRLASSLTADEWREVERVASATGTRAVCGDSVFRASVAFDTTIPSHIHEWRSTTGEPLAAYLRGVTELEHQVITLSRLGFASRVALICAHLFPSVHYMRGRYRSLPVLLLPLAYVHRATSGATRWLRDFRTARHQSRRS